MPESGSGGAQGPARSQRFQTGRRRTSSELRRNPHSSTQPGPAPVATPGDPLKLGRRTRLCLLSAVRALLLDPRLAGQPDSVRLSVIVLAAKAAHSTCRIRLSARELGRWIGMSASTVEHTVVPAFKSTRAVATRQTVDEWGQTTGLEFRVASLWAAKSAAGDPLALSKPQLATLLRLLEALFAPGWGENATPAGLLAARTGRGAATDRLALLLLVLQARPDGRVLMVGGTVAKGRGRGAATLARSLGCSGSGAAKVLTRLAGFGAVAFQPVVTGSGLFGKTRLVVPVVAAAHRRGGSADGRVAVALPAGTEQPPVCTRCAAEQQDLGASAEEDRSGRMLDGDAAPFVPNSAAAFGDLDTDPATPPLGGPGVPCREEADGAVVAERPVAAGLHAAHASRVEVEGDGATRDCFSGDSRTGTGDRPERAGAREDQLVDAGRSGDALEPPEGQGSPLRGEEPDAGSRGSDGGTSTGGGRPEPAGAARRRTSGRQQAGRGGRGLGEIPDDLTSVLAPVASLWRRVEHPSSRAWLLGLVRAELLRVSGVVGEGLAHQVLTERLTRRVHAQTAVVADPRGWLVSRGLPRQAGCYAQLCDDGRRMDTGEDCASCQLLIGDRRGLRSTVAVRAAADLPGVDRDALRAEIERRMRHAVRKRDADAAAHRERTAAMQERQRDAAARQRERRAAEELVRRAVACAGCGVAQAAGWCATCAQRQVAEEAITAAVALAVSTRVDVADRPAVRVVWARVEQQTRALLARQVGQVHVADAGAAGSVFTEVLLAQRLRDERWQEEQSWLMRSPDAESEAEAAYQAAWRCRHRHAATTEAAAREAAWEAGELARQRTAQALLQGLLRAVEAACAVEVEPVAATNWQQRLPELAARPVERGSTSPSAQALVQREGAAS